ncbi:MAG: hypothetical protein COZ46_02710 [Verrucomicrobia bacterium CG_4_10_14_3_um_filter_43_23]|nr:MAG: hypothetical protein AUJ82_06065 [Verrucomicrobia bacterium CG1_02_43_26]PIP60063.1 MAG: hypothetical protein COX01_00440 [Verrucomicrobia bacterium CG22_combo_CG10-13_8_21_14_all_43_17]PIX58690.1 MAG: hypothetical protein COZ46_02710 [Verrucomicrobia bacterium CG_4_10_14_3_um_filter_43_23]PIY62639.1 MAG: hypothetical protein COY94_01495 [Verrucomicrobia bacterium CG_4_10_14_0_8_um_filter_43_34]PJA43288.1 MAG: hypothetical protein CO175_08685 [Verrucomicrobia bacterium CG_4_9_14_3_um_fi
MEEKDSYLDTLKAAAATTFEMEKQYKLGSRRLRFIAFVLDVLLIAMLTVTLLWVFIIPEHYASEFQEFQKALEQFNDKVAAGEASRFAASNIKLTSQAQEMVQFMQGFVIMMFWFYFALSELLMKGGSLGKKIFSLRVISLKTMNPPSFFDTFLRSGLKTMALLTLFPVLLASYAIYLFTRERRAGHDYLARTVVIEDTPSDDADLQRK